MFALPMAGIVRGAVEGRPDKVFYAGRFSSIYEEFSLVNFTFRADTRFPIFSESQISNFLSLTSLNTPHAQFVSPKTPYAPVNAFSRDAKFLESASTTSAPLEANAKGGKRDNC